MFKLYIAKNTSSKELLQKVLDKYGIKDEIVYNDYGKPYLKNGAAYFNISHTDNLTVLVISSRKVGVDIEKITLRKNVIDKVCNMDEKKLIKTAKDFTTMWVKKESYAKYLGVGLAYGLKNIDTTKLKGFIIKKFSDYLIAIYVGDKSQMED